MKQGMLYFAKESTHLNECSLYFWMKFTLEDIARRLNAQNNMGDNGGFDACMGKTTEFAASLPTPWSI